MLNYVFLSKTGGAAMNRKTTKTFLSVLLIFTMLFSILQMNGNKSMTVLLPQAEAAESETVKIEQLNKGDIIFFGSYPQTEVKDEEIIKVLNRNASDWKSYGYYSGDRGCAAQGDRMKYCDIILNGEKYRGVYRQYVPDYPVIGDEPSSKHVQYANGYYTDTYYWFKYEPLKWRILDPDDGFVLNVNIIDSQAYQNITYKDGRVWYNNSEKNVYANDYATSSIRNWLNEVFYNTAFNSAEKSVIATTKTDNYAYPGYSQYDSQPTDDKIFLMSYDEMTNTSYGFNADEDFYNAVRRAKNTDYALSRGSLSSRSELYRGNGNWWLRSPGNESPGACGVYHNGSIWHDGNISYACNGVRPAFKFNPKADIAESAVTDAEPVNASNEYEIITFGSYPQTEVKDEAIVEALNSTDAEWKSYGYYSGNGKNTHDARDGYGTMVKGDWMKYCDVTLNGVKYRGIYFTKYRPYFTPNINSSDFSYQDDNGYYTDTYYWFRYEPIKWKVLDPDEGLILSVNIIDSQPFQNLIYHEGEEEYFGNAEKTRYANNYPTSSIRKWLNEDFYNTAFSADEKTEIAVAKVDNIAYDGYSDPKNGAIFDKIFLMSDREMKNSDYGFSSDDDRQAKNTDYAKSQGSNGSYSEPFYGNACSLLRTSFFFSHTAVRVFSYGNIFNTLTYISSDGIRPALKLNPKTPGDLNGDNRITSADARSALRIALKLDEASAAVLQLADVNGDNKVTTKDARIILRAALNLQKI